MMTPLINVETHYKAITGAAMSRHHNYPDRDPRHSARAVVAPPPRALANGPRLLQQQDGIISTGHSDLYACEEFMLASNSHGYGRNSNSPKPSF